MDWSCCHQKLHRICYVEYLVICGSIRNTFLTCHEVVKIQIAFIVTNINLCTYIKKWNTSMGHLFSCDVSTFLQTIEFNIYVLDGV
jgi:hypothetical protein